MERHVISRMFIFKNILEWAEQEELETITVAKFEEAVERAPTSEQIHMVNAESRGFSHAIT